jgi:8-oxo-dGTP diphosphatase
MTSLPARYSVFAAAVITDPLGRVLIIQRRDNGRWETPGGIIEPHETLIDGCAREVLEETGIPVALTDLVAISHVRPAGTVGMIYRGTTTSPGLKPHHSTEESQVVTWLTLDECQQRCSPMFYQRIIDALNYRDRPVVREYMGTQLIATIPQPHTRVE